MEIQVHRSIEKNVMPVEDDDSQKDLVTNGWAAGCYAQGQHSEDAEARAGTGSGNRRSNIRANSR